jgi:TorA maturation chaperone TorD
MRKHSHQFVEDYDGLVGYGYSREVDEYTLTYYLQKFSDDEIIAFIRAKMSDADMETLFNLLGDLLRKYLTKEEYQRLFLMDEKQG